jgi:N4-gp56 family major capsid protein
MARTSEGSETNSVLYAYERGAGTNPLATGQLGNYLGVEFYVTANGTTFSSLGFSGATVYGSLLFGDGAYGVVDLTADQARTYFKPRGSGGATGDPVDQVWSLGWKAAHTAAILNQNFLVRIEHTAALDPSYGG